MSNWETEVVELHEYFENYLNGKIPADQTSRMHEVLADAFTIVDPSGAISDKASTIGAISGQHGQLAGLKMWITDLELIAEAGDLVVGRYVEHQEFGGDRNRRLSSVVFRAASQTPNGLQWTALHETWQS